MHFFLPDTIPQAVELLGQRAGYCCLAGGGLVVPALRVGEKPAGLISLKRVGGLHGIVSLEDGTVRIGAMTPHIDVMQSQSLRGGVAMVRRAAGEIAHPVIRNMATIGGTLCRADPSADYSCALLAADAMIHLGSRDGERVVALENFVIDDNRTVRREDELLVAVSLRSDLGRSTSGYARFSRVDGDYPVATAAIRLDWRDDVVISARIAIGGCGSTALRAIDSEALICGAGRIEEMPLAAIDAAVAAARPISDIKGSADFRRRLIPGLLRRAWAQALATAAP